MRHYAARRDKSEPAIVDALKQQGCIVYRLSGKGVPDLLVFYEGRWLPMEVKTPKKERARGNLDAFTEAQHKAMQLAPWPVVETPEQAISLLASPQVLSR